MKAPKNLEKIAFWKHKSWFPSKVAKLTSAKKPWNDAYSGMKKEDFNQYYVVAFDPISILHTKHLKMTV